MRRLLPLILLALAACGPAPSGSRPAPPPVVRVWNTALGCTDSAGHFASCAGNPVEVHECVVAVDYGRCPGDPRCFDAAGRQTTCVRPWTLTPLRVEEGAWTPDDATIRALEAKLLLPERAHVLDDYRRFYAGTVVAGRRTVMAIYVAKTLQAPGQRTPGVEIAPDIYRVENRDYLPNWQAGGCAVITVYFDTALGEQSTAFCNTEN